MSESQLLQLLLEIDEADQDYMQGKGWNWDFEPLDAEITSDLNAIESMMGLVPVERGLD